MKVPTPGKLCYKTPMATERFFTIAEAARKAKVSRQAINEAIANKRLRSRRQTIKKTIVKKMRVIVIAESDLKKFKETVSRSHQERGFKKPD
jgi:SOS response regulatory protein OraA/RecX